MANVTTGWGGIVYPDATENVDVPADMAQLANSLNVKVLGYFANTAARDAARATIGANTPVLSYVQGQGVCIWDGTQWVWVGDPPSPVVFSTTFGLSADLQYVAWTPIAYNFAITPTRTGFADVFCDYDVQMSFTGFGGAQFRVLQDGFLIDGSPIVLYDAVGARTTGRMAMRPRVKLGNGVTSTFSVQVSNIFAAGLWHFNSFGWFIGMQ